MKCDKCGNLSVYRSTLIVNGVSQTTNLCRDCAIKEGVFVSEPTSLFEENGLILDFKIECLGREAVVVNGYKTIVKLTEGEVVLKLKKQDTITIKGARLYIKGKDGGNTPSGRRLCGFFGGVR